MKKQKTQEERTGAEAQVPFCLNAALDSEQGNIMSESASGPGLKVILWHDRIAFLLFSKFCPALLREPHTN